MTKLESFPFFGRSGFVDRRSPKTDFRTKTLAAPRTRLTTVALTKLKATELRSLPGILARAFGPDHPEVVKGLHKLAALHHARGDLAAAKPLYVRALDAAERVFGDQDLEVARILNNLGKLHHEQEAFAQAESMYKRSVVLMQKILGPEHPKLSTPLANLAMLYRHQGRLVLAGRFGCDALSILEKALGPTHPKVVRARIRLRG